MQKEIYFLVPEVAKYLCVSTSKIYKLTSKNQIPHYKPFGPKGKNIFKKTEIDTWVEASQANPIEKEVDYLLENLSKGGAND